MKTNKTSKVIINLIAILFVAGLGSVFVALGMEWFDSLYKPTQWIPNFIIPIVWTIIYVVFAVCNSKWILSSSIPKCITILLIANGVLNVLWCLIFFTLHLTFVGSIVIVINLILAYMLVLNIKKYNVSYFFATAIYPIWVSIATCLNIAMWILN